MIRRFFPLAGLVTLVAACSYHPVELKHPETGDFASCGFTHLGEPSEKNLRTAEACARHFEQQGYVRATLAE
ncbi:MAG TPA: hypothetical protein VFO41_00695 [Alphaproteobacteria bacterium]|nr:hypothetical protein [Alphaproteobacteria bacterium]